MSFKTIAARVQQYTGLDLSSADERSFILEIVNEAAKELYDSGDLQGLMSEGVFTFDPNYQISIPTFASNIRGMRDYNYRLRQELAPMGERYGENPWFHDWRRYRIKANSPIERDIDNAGVIEIRCTTVGATAGSIVITGSTLSSSRVTETVSVTATTGIVTTNQYSEIHSITGLTPSRTVDYTFYDLSGNLLATLPNNQLSTDYQVLLLSSYPWATVMNPQTMEFLFKKNFVPFVNDSDEFTAPGFDGAIYWKVQANWDATIQDRDQRAILADSKSKILRDNVCNDKLNKSPDARVVVTPAMGMRLQRIISMYPGGRFNYTRSRL